MDYELMYKNMPVVRFNSKSLDNYIIVDEKRLPIGMQNGMNLEGWLKQRRADQSRVSVRKLLATLKMNFGDDAYVSQFRKPTDFWWLRKHGSAETFESSVEDLHLIGLNLASVVPKSPRNFEMTNIGSYDKGWKNNQLVKRGHINELFSEWLYAKISSAYMPTAKYDIETIEGCLFITTANFISKEEGEFLVLADEWTATGPTDNFETWFSKFSGILREEEIDGLKMMHFLDVVLNNFDRHCQNFGFVYRECGERTLAPNFDFNLSIVGYNELSQLGANEMAVDTYFDVFETLPKEAKVVPEERWLLENISEITQLLNLDENPYRQVVDWIRRRWLQLIERSVDNE